MYGNAVCRPERLSFYGVGSALRRLRPKVQPAQRRVDGKPTRVFVGLGFVTQEPAPEGALF